MKQPEYICPKCHGTADRMPVLSALGVFDDFVQCRACQQVSTVPKSGLGTPAPVQLLPRPAMHRYDFR
jgi:hypothetical protein